MNQPSVYSRNQIIETAFQLIREKGWNAVSVRSIAKKVGSSTMPIYSHMGSMEELENELHSKAQALLKEFQQRHYTEHVLLNLAFGYVAFARDERNLFRYLFLEKPQQRPLEDGAEMKAAFLADFGENSEAGKALAGLREAGHETMIQYTWVFTHGLATLVNGGALGSCPDQLILRYLKDAGEAFYSLGIAREEQDGETGEKREEEPWNT